MVDEDLLDGADPIGELERGEVVDLVVAAGEGAHGARGTRAELHGGRPDQTNLGDVLDREPGEGVGLADDQRVAIEADQADVPDVPLAVQGNLPALALWAAFVLIAATAGARNLGTRILLTVTGPR